MKRPLRIAFFVGSFPVVSETFILRQITGLLDLGHEVDIYADTRAEPGAAVQPEVERYQLMKRTTFMDMPPEVAPWEMPVWPLTGRTWPPGAATPIHNSVRFARALPKLFRCLTFAPRLASRTLRASEYRYQAASLSALHRLARCVAQRKRYDVLHAHFGPVGNSFRFARQLWHAPMVVSFHGYDFSSVPRKEGCGMYAKLFKTADQFTVNSDYTGGCVERLGCPPEKIRKLPVGLDPTEFPFRERSKPAGAPVRLLTVARLVEIKGHEFCLRAVAEVRKRHPDLRYDIVGDGPLRTKLESLAEELKLRDIVVFHGAKAGAELHCLLEDAHLFLLCSVSIEGDQEGQGLALQEAQACGLPVIATRHGAFPEGLLDGESGFLVAERDVLDLAGRLAFLLDHPECWAAMGRAGWRFVENRFDVRELNRQLQEIYNQLSAGLGRRAAEDAKSNNDQP
jgi:colanic acid/amylovoran biosynthesis glycosyltransferase